MNVSHLIVLGIAIFHPGADWLDFSARAQFDQIGPRIVENVKQWAEMLQESVVTSEPTCKIEILDGC